MGAHCGVMQRQGAIRTTLPITLIAVCQQELMLWFARILGVMDGMVDI
jgi:hypothetical protein